MNMTWSSQCTNIQQYEHVMGSWRAEHHLEDWVWPLEVAPRFAWHLKQACPIKVRLVLRPSPNLVPSPPMHNSTAHDDDDDGTKYHLHGDTEAQPSPPPPLQAQAPVRCARLEVHKFTERHRKYTFTQKHRKFTLMEKSYEFHINGKA